MSDTLAEAEVSKLEFATNPSPDKVMPFIRKAHNAWWEGELEDIEYAEYLELVVAWLKHE